MSDLVRILEDRSVDAFEAALLRAARASGASPAAREKTLHALGLTGAPVASAPATGAAAAGAAGAAGATHVVLKVLAVTALLVAAVAGLVVPRLFRPQTPPAALGEPAPAAGRGASAGASGVPGEPGAGLLGDATQPAIAGVPRTTSSETARPASAHQPTPRPAAPSQSTKPARTGAPDPAAAEIRLLDQARTAVRARQGARALALLDEHARRFPRPLLGDEASVTRVEALLVAGERAAARALADRLLRDAPESVHAQRVRSLLGTGSRSGEPASKPAP